MAEFKKLPTQEELQRMLYMGQLQGKSNQEIIADNLAAGSTIKALPDNFFQKIAKGAGIAKEQVNKLGNAADLARMFPGYTGESQVRIPTGYNFAPKQDVYGGVTPQGLQTQPINVNQLLQAIKPADVLGITGAQQAYTDVGMGKAPNPMDVLDIAGLGAAGLGAGKGLLGVAKATKGLPVGMSIKDVSKTEFDIAHEVAQKNATEMLGLPPNNTAMDRAKAMGFDTDIFHASAKTTPKSIYENGVYLGTIEPELRNLEKVIPNKGGGEGGAFFGTNATDIAKTYAIPTKERAGATYPLKVRSSDFMQSGFNTPMPEGSISQWMKDATLFNRNLDKTKNKYFNEKIKESKSKGYGGTVFKNVEDAAYDIGSVPMSDIYAINSAPVRSRFAAFDPRRINEPDLLAAGLPLGLLAWQEEDMPKRKQKKSSK